MYNVHVERARKARMSLGKKAEVCLLQRKTAQSLSSLLYFLIYVWQVGAKNLVKRPFSYISLYRS
jgi:hypothetical protein